MSDQTALGAPDGSDHDQQVYRSRLQIALGYGYDVRVVLGLGAFGVVYAVRDSVLDRDLAVKVLRLHTPEFLERFQREAKILAKLRHPHIVPLYFVGSGEGLFFFVMPRIDGENLRVVLERHGQLPGEEVCRITSGLANALDEAHAAEIVHRDIKPENVLFDGKDRRIQLTDFGVAKILENPPGDFVVGTIIGTVQYMSPEQCSGDPAIDTRSDVYSLGCLVYEMLVGRPPFTGCPREVFAMHLTAPPPKLRPLRRNIPPETEQHVLKALAKHASDRFPKAGDFALALANSLAREEHGRKWWHPW